MSLQEEGEEIDSISEYIGTATNNVAEYKALEAGIKKAIDLGYTDLAINADSELMIKQLKGEYKVKNADLKKIYDSIKLLLQKVESFQLQHVPRNENKRADALANAAF